MNRIAKIFVDNYIKTTNNDKEEFKTAFQNMIQRGFVVKQASEKNYNFIMRNEVLFKSLFEIIGFTFYAEYRIETFYIKSDNNQFAKNIKKNDTILLLVLRLLYEEEVTKVNLDNVVNIKYQQLEQKLLEINFESVNRERVILSSIMESLRLFRDHNIINFIITGFNTDTEITIYPSIEVVFDFNDLDFINNRLNLIVKEGEDDEAYEG